MVAPNGRFILRNPLMIGLRQSYGAWQKHPGSLIHIRNIMLQWQRHDTVLVTYEEWQTIGEQKTARASTVLFGLQDGLPNGLVWLHVHETWLDL